MKKILLDTNILIYYINKSGEFNKQVTDILQNKNYELYISTKNISEFFVVMTKYKVDWDNILKYIIEITNIATIIYPNSNSVAIFKELCKKYKPHRNQVFDIEIISIMLANKLDIIATFNYKDFKNVSEISILKDCK